MPFPDDRGVFVLRPFLGGVAERCIPAPRICANNFNPALCEPERCFCSQAHALISEIICAVNRARLDQHNVERLKLVLNLRKPLLQLSGANDSAMRQMREVELNARAEKPVERGLVNAGGWACSCIRSRVIMPRCIHMRAIVRG